MISYLNDLDTGSETQISSLRLQIRPKPGRVLIFGKNWLGTAEAPPHTARARRTVGTGKKWALTHWWRRLAYHVRREYPVEDGKVRMV